MLVASLIPPESRGTPCGLLSVCKLATDKYARAFRAD
jgi:hypothetical protein